MTSLNDAHALEALLDYLKRSRGFDFSAYKRSSLTRRIEKRMRNIGVDTLRGYMDYLEVHPDEFTELFNTILINVTSFFRDPPTWEFLAAEVIPDLVASRTPDEPIRVWSAGCASGQEAYSLAMLLAEFLGLDALKERVKVYATDVDEEALSQARQASYMAKDLEAVPRVFVERYLERSAGRYVFHQDLRRGVIFGRHNLIQDAPISRVDLLLCRNTMMYFNAKTQAEILARFHFALSDRGFLVLGQAETLLRHDAGFRTVNLSRRLFAKATSCLPTPSVSEAAGQRR